MPYVRKINIQFTGNSSGRYSCSQHDHSMLIALPQNLRHMWYYVIRHIRTFESLKMITKMNEFRTMLVNGYSVLSFSNMTTSAVAEIHFDRIKNRFQLWFLDIGYDSLSRFYMATSSNANRVYSCPATFKNGHRSHLEKKHFRPVIIFVLNSVSSFFKSWFRL